jgi:hypothetical protein
VPRPERHATLPTHVPTCLAANPTTTMRGAVKGGPQGRPAGTAAKRRPLTAPVISDPTIDVAPTAQVGAWKTTTAPRSEAHLTLFRDGRRKSAFPSSGGLLVSKQIQIEVELIGQ